MSWASRCHRDLQDGVEVRGDSKVNEQASLVVVLGCLTQPKHEQAYCAAGVGQDFHCEGVAAVLRELPVAAGKELLVSPSAKVVAQSNNAGIRKRDFHQKPS